MTRARFVAEVSSNHARELGRALRFVDAAADAGCDAVKFQQFRIDRLFAPEALARRPDLRSRRTWELPVELNAELAARARERGIAFASTPFDLDAIGALAPFVDFFKVSSYQVPWTDLLREVARAGKPVVLATGMATLAEVERAVEALAEGGCERPTLLHCVSLYPAPVEAANLRVLATLRERFGLPVGWSDHTRRPEVVRRAVAAFGAAMVEAHLDLDRGGAEYALGHCWLPGELAGAIARQEEDPGAGPWDGDGVKAPHPGEAVERRWRSDPSDGLRPELAVRRELAGNG